MTLNKWYSSSEITVVIPGSLSAQAAGTAAGTGDMLAGAGVGCVECFEDDGEMEP
jgi:hypothetical protein